MRHNPWFFAAILVFSLSCSKKANNSNEFVMEATPDDAFTKIVETVVGLGFETDQIDSSSRTLQTNFKEVDSATMKNYASLKEDSNRYDKGRYGYKISVLDKDGKALVHVDAMVEGFYHPPQSTSASFGTDKTWQPQVSKGVAEQQLATTLH